MSGAESGVVTLSVVVVVVVVVVVSSVSDAQDRFLCLLCRFPFAPGRRTVLSAVNPLGCWCWG